MEPFRCGLAALLLMLPQSQIASAQTSLDPGWPCPQRRVDHLSLGAYWPGQVADDDPLSRPEMTDISSRLALRRIDLDEARAVIANLAASHPEFSEPEYGRIFADTLERIDRDRARIIAGIGRYAANEQRLASQVQDLRDEMTALEAAAEPDFDRMDEVEAEIDGRERVFTDRARALTYVCDSPVLLEKRAYEVAQALLAVVP